MADPVTGLPTVAGLDRTVWDCVVTVPEARASEVLVRNRLAAEGVQRVEDAGLLLHLQRELAHDGSLVMGPGGPVSNTLHAMALSQAGLVRDLRLQWIGVSGRRDAVGEPAVGPLDSLRQVGIVPWVLDRAPRHDRTLCVVAQERRTVQAVLVTDRPLTVDASVSMEGWPEPDLLLVALRDLVTAPARLRALMAGSAALAVVLGDGARRDAAHHGQLERLASSGRLRWVFGQAGEHDRLGLTGPGGRATGSFAGVELVATRGRGPTAVWDPVAGRRRELPVAGTAVPEHGDDLGAGDAYAGAFLHARLCGEPVDGAHAAGAALARSVLGTRGARLPSSEDLGARFGHLTDRSTARRDEGMIHRRVRRAPGLVVVSGGQTGVDQLALGAAADLGLPAFAVLPRARRTYVTDGVDQGPDDFGDAHLTELGSPSYRHRTWVTVHVGDGTVLWDLRGSEGCAATRQAARALGRPVLDLAIVPGDRQALMVRRWLATHDIGVVHLAGTGGPLLAAADRRRIRRQLVALLRGAAFARVRWAAAARPARRREPGGHAGAAERAGPAEGRPCVSVGVVSATAHRRIFERFLHDAYGLAAPPSRQLVTRFQDQGRDLDLRVVYARAVDLPRLLEEGAIDVALGDRGLFAAGLDRGRCAVLLDTGLFPLFLVLLGHAGRGPPAGGHGRFRGLRIGSQYPELATARLRALGYDGVVREIGGTAEAWLACGLLDAAVDTWRTGATSDANRTELLGLLEETSLVLAASTTTARAGARRLAATLAAWLRAPSTPRQLVPEPRR
jgi:hypothetical protein